MGTGWKDSQKCAGLRLTSLKIRADCAEPNFVLACHFGSEAAHHQRQGKYYHILVLVILFVRLTTTVCVLIPICMCPLLYMRPHITIYVNETFTEFDATLPYMSYSSFYLRAQPENRLEGSGFGVYGLG